MRSESPSTCDSSNYSIWEEIEYEKDVARENERRDTPELSGDLMHDGNSIEPHTNDRETARELRLQNEELDRKIQTVNEELTKLKNTLQQDHDKKYAEIKAQLEAAISDADAREKRHKQVLEDEKKARELQDEEYKKQVQKRDSEHQEQVQKLQQQFLQQSSTNSTPVTIQNQPSIDSTPATPNKQGWFSCLSLTGEYYTFIHSEGSSKFWPTTLDNSVIKDVEFPGWVALGTNKSWYRYYTNKNGGDPKCQRSRNFSVEYPALEEMMNTHQLYSKPYCLSLGTNGNYFAYFATRRAWNVDYATSNHIGDVERVSRMWFGKNGAYIAALEDGRYKWDLRGGYTRLDPDLRNKNHGSISAIAMDLKDDQEYIAVWDSYWWSFRLNDPIEEEFLMCLWKNGYPAPK